MMQFFAWFQQLELREQRVLLGGTLLTIGLLTYFLLWQPLNQAYDELKNRVTAQQATLLWMQTAAQQVQQLRAKNGDNSRTQPLLPTIERSLQAEPLAKLTKRIEPKSDSEVQVNIEQINFTELATWLALLQNQFAIQVQRVNISRLSTADKVKAQITLTN
jgi:general secretion pathway protein M